MSKRRGRKRQPKKIGPNSVAPTNVKAARAVEAARVADQVVAAPPASKRERELPIRDGRAEASIPPAGDLEVEAAAERFFWVPELGAAADELDDPAAFAPPKRAPHVAARRARFARYVRWAVAGAVALCLAALVRSGVHSRAQEPGVSAPAAAALAPDEAPPPPAVKEAPPRPEPAPDPVVRDGPLPPPSAAAPPAVAEAAPATPFDVHVGAKAQAASPPPPSHLATPAPVEDRTSAAAAKAIARRELEAGRTIAAISAGERSVALDPRDGEAWLILGAAYQEKGNMAEARRCYASCLREGRRGPIDECRAMLR